jgi:hypothetical protein
MNILQKDFNAKKSRERRYFETNTALVRLIKMCVNETFSNILIGETLSDAFYIQNDLKAGALSPLLFNFALEYNVRQV